MTVPDPSLVAEDLRYPIGRFAPPDDVDDGTLATWIDRIGSLPARLRALVEPLDDARLDTPYRPGGWTVRQVVHHLADSHLNSTVRFRWALTEDAPLIKAYDERAWAKLPDARDGPPALSLDLLDALHRRWVVLLRALGPEERARTFTHPESGESIRLDVNVGVYAWHGDHHLAHVAALAEREGW